MFVFRFGNDNHRYRYLSFIEFFCGYRTETTEYTGTTEYIIPRRAHFFSMVDISISTAVGIASVPKRTALETYRRELSDVSFGVAPSWLSSKSSLENRSRGVWNTPSNTVSRPWANLASTTTAFILDVYIYHSIPQSSTSKNSRYSYEYRVSVRIYSINIPPWPEI